MEWGAISGGLGPSGIDGPNIWARAGFGLPKIIKIRARADFGLCFLKNVGLGPSRASKKREKPVGLSGSGKLDPSLLFSTIELAHTVIHTLEKILLKDWK